MIGSGNKTTLWYILFVIVTVIPGVQTVAQTGDVVPLGMVNNSAQCSAQTAITVHLFRSTHSVQRALKPKKATNAGVFTGEYTAMTNTSDGTPVETTRLRVRPITCTIPFGCPYFIPSATSKDTLFSALEFYNTTNDCAVPKTVLVAVNGQLLGKVAPGAHKRLVVPKGPAYLAVLQGNQRLMVTCIDPKVQPYEFYGCTDPAYYKKRKNGIVISFRNSTDACGAGKTFPVVLWVDGFPVKGLKPKSSAFVIIPKGSHRLSVTKDLTGKPLFEQPMNCSKSFLFNYGCGKAK